MHALDINIDSRFESRWRVWVDIETSLLTSWLFCVVDFSTVSAQPHVCLCYQKSVEANMWERSTHRLLHCLLLLLPPPVRGFLHVGLLRKSAVTRPNGSDAKTTTTTRQQYDFPEDRDVLKRPNAAASAPGPRHGAERPSVRPIHRHRSQLAHNSILNGGRRSGRSIGAENCQCSLPLRLRDVWTPRCVPPVSSARRRKTPTPPIGVHCTDRSSLYERNIYSSIDGEPHKDVSHRCNRVEVGE